MSESSKSSKRGERMFPQGVYESQGGLILLERCSYGEET